ncbi:MAG: hypothetical protein Q9M97_10340 [Candidatus Gracilibacteria bacterium]|nr:hypothetical protein [Candidatus Gracilibacteria bacterium]
MDKYWDKELTRFKIIKSVGINEYIRMLGTGVMNAFKEKTGCVCCMDDRTEDGQLRLAGSGILLAEEIGIDGVVKIMKDFDVDEVTSHDDCGAAKLYASNKNLDISKSDEYAKEFSKELAEKAGLPYRHIIVENPHAARCIYIDFTNMFNPKGIHGLPKGFEITARGLPLKHIIDEIEVAYTVSTGEDLFGDRINENSQFYIFVVGTPDNFFIDL